MSRESPVSASRTPLGVLAGLFLKLGATAFGGPAAHIAMMEDEVVHRRRWLAREQFLDLLGATNLIPGPNSTELAIHVGFARSGWPGLIVAGTCFILPAAFIVTALAWAYVRFGRLPETAGILYGVKPVVIAIVAQALWRLGRAALKTWGLGVLAVAAAIATALGVDELVVLGLSGAAMFIARRVRGTSPPDERASPSDLPTRRQRDAERGDTEPPGKSPEAGGLMLLPLGPAGAIATAAGPTGVGLWPLFAFFVKVGSVLFGSGYVLLAFLRSDLVEHYRWLTEAQLLDAIAVGQVTPGPVFTTATFIGYLLAGGAGAAVATLGIFLPAFIFVAVSGPFIPRLRRSPAVAAVLDGVNAASLALMAVVTVRLGAAALVDLLTLALSAASVLLLVRYRVNSTWLVLGGAVVGLVALR
jgi:chromate transporter